MRSSGHRTTANRRVRVTITDVVGDLNGDLNIAKSTVSRALNGYNDISEGTRKRVEKATDRLGYRPLTHAQAIRTGRVLSMGLVLRIETHTGGSPFLGAFIAGATQASSAQGWTVTIATAQDEAGVGDTIERLAEAQKVDGFILPRTLVHDKRVDLLRDRGVLFIVYRRAANAEGYAWYDIEDAMRATAARLASLDRSRIAHVPGGPEFTYADLRMDGYRAGLTAAGLPFDPILISAPAVTGDRGAQRTRAAQTPRTAHRHRIRRPPRRARCLTGRRKIWASPSTWTSRSSLTTASPKAPTPMRLSRLLPSTTARRAGVWPRCSLIVSRAAPRKSCANWPRPGSSNGGPTGP